MLEFRRARVRGALVALLMLWGCDGGSVDPSPDGGARPDGAIDGGATDGGGASDGGPSDGGNACDDADRDGECDGDDATCEADGTRLACRRVAPECEAGTVPEVREGCYTDRCVTWVECAALVGPPACTGDADCGPGEVCRLAVCEPATCERRATVPTDDPFYERFEGIGAANACTQDADCFAGGCSGEVCAAEIVASTCEGLPRHPSGGCGCVAGQCVWHVVDCGTPTECRSDADCGEGHVCIAGACVEASCERAPTVSPRDRYYERFEGIGLANRCATDADCVVGGCSSEVCAAEGAATTCEGLPYGPEGGCGCVAGECVWHRDDCGPSGNACEPIRDGELGFCDLVLGWGVSATTGACATISGCGCDPATCDGRIFPSEAECQRACAPSACAADADRDGICDAEDPTCNSDGVELSCRRVAPPCARGTVPEVREGCYTDACVTWAECARLRDR
jgi:eight-cysteine-cluster-containing protein